MLADNHYANMATPAFKWHKYLILMAIIKNNTKYNGNIYFMSLIVITIKSIIIVDIYH